MFKTLGGGDVIVALHAQYAPAGGGGSSIFEMRNGGARGRASEGACDENRRKNNSYTDCFGIATVTAGAGICSCYKARSPAEFG